MEKIKNTFSKQQNRIIHFLLIMTALIYLSYMPYVNVVFNLNISLVLSYLVFMFFFRPSPKVTFTVGIILIFITIPWLLVGSRVRVEGYGEVSFYLFVVAIIQAILKARKEK